MKTDRTMEILKDTIRDEFRTLRIFEKEGNDRMVNYIVYESLAPLTELLGKCIGIYLTIEYQNGHYKLMTYDQFMAQ